MLARELRGVPVAVMPRLQRVGLDRPTTMQDRVARALLVETLLSD
jgi:hypothetical protein